MIRARFPRTFKNTRISIPVNSNWTTSTGRPGPITLRRTKGRRRDVMPLPAATGEVIATYLQRERPKTSQRTVFVRRVPPYDLPITRDSC